MHWRAAQRRVRGRILRALVRRGSIEHGEADQMGAWEHGGGSSIDASVRIEGTDRPALERLLRYGPKEVPWRDEAFPLAWPICHSEMRIVAFINEPSTVRKILDHIGEATQPPPITPARGPPLWQAAAASEQAENDPQRDTSAQPGPHIQSDQRIAG